MPPPGAPGRRRVTERELSPPQRVLSRAPGQLARRAHPLRDAVEPRAHLGLGRADVVERRHVGDAQDPVHALEGARELGRQRGLRARLGARPQAQAKATSTRRRATAAVATRAALRRALAEPAAERRWAGRDGLAVEVAADVLRQGPRRVVAPRRDPSPGTS